MTTPTRRGRRPSPTCSPSGCGAGRSSRARTGNRGSFTTTRTGAGGSGVPAVKQAKTDSAKASPKGRSSGIPPYDLRHAFASLQIRAGLSIPELAEQMGHSPQRTLATYAHVIRELKGLPRLSAEEIGQAREARGREVDVSDGAQP